MFFTGDGSMDGSYTRVDTSRVCSFSSPMNGDTTSLSSSSDELSSTGLYPPSPRRIAARGFPLAKGTKPPEECSDFGFSRSWKWLDTQSYSMRRRLGGHVYALHIQRLAGGR